MYPFVVSYVLFFNVVPMNCPNKRVKEDTICIKLTVVPLELGEMKRHVRNFRSLAGGGSTLLKIEVNKFTDGQVSCAISSIANPLQM